jgi:hypothetical protein
MRYLLPFTFMLMATQASALPPLKDVPEIRDGIIAAGMAIEIGDQCDSISVRLLRGALFLNSLKSRAEDLGYSRDEIDAYVDDRAEKSRLEGVARARLAELGAVAGQGDTYCAVGQSQIDLQTSVGRLLR